MREKLAILALSLASACAASKADAERPPASPGAVAAAKPAPAEPEAAPADREAKAKWLADSVLSMSQAIHAAMTGAGGDCKKAAANLAPLADRAASLRGQMDDLGTAIEADADLRDASERALRAIEPEVRRLFADIEPTMTSCQADADFQAAVSAASYMRKAPR